VFFIALKSFLVALAWMPRNQEINSTETPTRDLAPANLGCAAPLRRDSIPALFSGPTLFLPRKLL
jgi:hypothetical protein